MKISNDIEKECDSVFEKALNEEYSKEDNVLITQLESTSKSIMAMISLPKDSPKYEKAVNGITSAIIKAYAIANSIDNLKYLSVLFQKKISKMKLVIKKSLPLQIMVSSIGSREEGLESFNEKESIVLFENISSDIQNIMSNMVYIVLISSQTKTIDIILNASITEITLSFEQIDYLISQYKPMRLLNSKEIGELDIRKYLINTSDASYDVITQGIDFALLFKVLLNIKGKSSFIQINSKQEEFTINLSQCTNLNEIIQSFQKIINQSQSQIIKTTNETQLKQIFTY